MEEICRAKKGDFFFVRYYFGEKPLIETFKDFSRFVLDNKKIENFTHFHVHTDREKINAYYLSELDDTVEKFKNEVTAFSLEGTINNFDIEFFVFSKGKQLFFVTWMTDESMSEPMKRILKEYEQQ